MDHWLKRNVCTSVVAGDRDEPILNLSNRRSNSDNVDRVCNDECNGVTLCVCRTRVCGTVLITFCYLHCFSVSFALSSVL